MKKSKKRLLVWVNQILSGMLVLLGFASCVGESPDEYGSPYAKYEIKGKVVDYGQNPVPDARIIVKQGRVREGNGFRLSMADTVYTAKDGTYLYNEEGLTEVFRIVCEDTSGECKSDSTDVTPKTTGGKGWYEGTSSDEVNFELKKK